MPGTRDFEDADNFETIIGSDGCPTKVLRDGARVRVPQYLRDSVPDRPPLTHDETMVRYYEHDAQRRRQLHVEAPGNQPFSLGRPGYRHLVAADGNREQQATLDAARQKVLDARRAYQNDLENSWRNTSPTGAGERGHPFATPQAGNPCTKDGWPGHWAMDDDGNMVCIVDTRGTGDSDGRSLQQLLKDRAAIMEPLYQQQARELGEAWKTK